MIKDLVKKNQTELPALFDTGMNVTMSRAQLEAMLVLIKTAQTTGDINEQIRALQRLQNILDKFLK